MMIHRKYNIYIRQENFFYSLCYNTKQRFLGSFILTGAGVLWTLL